MFFFKVPSTIKQKNIKIGIPVETSNCNRQKTDKQNYLNISKISIGLVLAKSMVSSVR